MSTTANHIAEQSRAPVPGGGDFMREPGDDEFWARHAAYMAALEDVDLDAERAKATFVVDLAAEIDRRESYAPTINHVPTVTLLDQFGGERLMTFPLAEDERWKPAYADKAKNLRWEGWRVKYDGAKTMAARASEMRFANRVADGVIKALQPKKKAKPPKADESEETKKKRADAIQRAKDKAERPSKRRARVAERLRSFDHDTTLPRAGRTYTPFSVSYRDGKGVGTAQRSELGIVSLALYSSRVPKNALYGNDKEAVQNATVSGIEPIFLRDATHLTCNWWSVRGQLAVDLDETFNTLADLRAKLIEHLGVALLPTIIIYRLDWAGRIERPHLLWILPPGSEVGVGGKSRGAPIRTHRMVQQALVSALIDLGGDAGHLNTGKTKNPLSEYWSLACLESFPDLRDFIAHLPTVVTDEKEMRRRQRKVRNVAEGEQSESNAKYNVIKTAIKQAITTGFRTHDAAFLAALPLESSTAFGEWLKGKILPEVRQALGVADGDDLPDDVARLLHKQIRWRCRNRPSVKTRYYDGDNRRRDKELQSDLGMTGAETHDARVVQRTARRSLAAVETNRLRREASLTTIGDQIGLFVRASGDIDDRSAVVRWVILSKKLSKTTVYDLIDLAVSRFRAASRYIASTPHGRKPSPVEQPAAVVIVTGPVVTTSIEPVVIASGESGQTEITLSSPPPSICQRVAALPESGIPVERPPCGPSTPTTWLHWDDRRIAVRSTAIMHGPHPTPQ